MGMWSNIHTYGFAPRAHVLAVSGMSWTPATQMGCWPLDRSWLPRTMWPTVCTMISVRCCPSELPCTMTKFSVQQKVAEAIHRNLGTSPSEMSKGAVPCVWHFGWRGGPGRDHTSHGRWFPIGGEQERRRGRRAHGGAARSKELVVVSILRRLCCSSRLFVLTQKFVLSQI